MTFLDEFGDGLEAAAAAERRRIERRRTVARVGGLGVLVAGLAVGGFVVAAGGDDESEPALDGERLPVPGEVTTTSDPELFEPADVPPSTRPGDESDSADDSRSPTAPLDALGDDGEKVESDQGAVTGPSSETAGSTDPTDDVSTGSPTANPGPSASTTSIGPGDSDVAGGAPPTTTEPATPPTDAPTTTTTSAPSTAGTTTTTTDAPPDAPCAPASALTADQLDPAGAAPVSWSDGVTLTALTTSGEIGTPIVRRGAIGVDGGRYDFQIDLMPAAQGDPTTEAVTVRFDQPACEIELGIAMLETDEFDGLDESFEWTAMGLDDAVVGTGVRSAGDTDEIGGVRRFALPLDAPAAQLTVRPVAYGAGTEPTASPNNSDFGLAELVIGPG
ncbi:MAG: hypothetical protein AAGF91_06625 [Actinomycetota bacterium]